MNTAAGRYPARMEVAALAGVWRPLFLPYRARGPDTVGSSLLMVIVHLPSELMEVLSR